MGWIHSFSATASETDKFSGKPNHLSLLAAGLIGEAGSVLTELKKSAREREAYPIYRTKMYEEVGDFLWYFVRVVDVVAPDLLPDLKDYPVKADADEALALANNLKFASLVGSVAGLVSEQDSNGTELRKALRQVWESLLIVAAAAGVQLEDAAKQNIKKIQSRWPLEKKYHGFFDEDLEEEEQLPRELEVEFRERLHNGMSTVFLRCNGVSFGDRLTDNIEDRDGYRFHDIFHFAYAVHLGWSPVIRALLKTKRKSKSKTDEEQDGARAIIVEEAVSASAFSRSKQLNFFDGIDKVDYDLLKTIREFVAGFEVDKVPLWQWETAILEGNRVFRLLKANRGGIVKLDMRNRTIKYTAPMAKRH